MVDYGFKYARRKRLVVFRGLPGSGKTYQARKLVKAKGGVLVENDQFWSRPSRPYVSWPDNPDLWKELQAWVRARVFRAMYHGADVVALANVHVRPSSFEWVWPLADSFEYAVEVRKMHEVPTEAEMVLWLGRGHPTMNMAEMRRMAGAWIP